jgi:lysophospholipase L1-like esterase
MSSVAKIYCFGDSNTFSGGYPESLRGMLTAERPEVQWSVENGGVFGCSVSGCLPPIGELGNVFRPSAGSDLDIILLMLGTNDAVNYDINFKTGNVDQVESMFSDRLARLATSIQKMAPGAELMIVTPPPLSSDRTKSIAIAKAFRKVMSQIACNLGINCIDCFSALEALEQTESLKGDGLHITDASGRLIASTILPHVISAFSRSSKGQKLGLNGVREIAQPDGDAQQAEIAQPDGDAQQADDADQESCCSVEETVDFESPGCAVACISPLEIFSEDAALLSSALKSFLKRASFVF